MSNILIKIAFLIRIFKLKNNLLEFYRLHLEIHYFFNHMCYSISILKLYASGYHTLIIMMINN